METNEGAQTERNHVLLIPYPSQGHINPMLQFAKRLAFYGLKPTLAVTRFILNTNKPDPGPVGFEPFSDGFDEAGFSQAESISSYLARLESSGSESLDNILLTQRAQGRPFKVIIYDAFLPWALEVGKRRGVPAAAFFTQSCAVNTILCHTFQGRLSIPFTEPEVLLPGLPGLGPHDLPSFLVDSVDGPYPAYLQLVLNQFSNLEKADEVFINSFHELEPQESEWMKRAWGSKTIGPTVPSKYLDKRVPGDTHYGFNLFNGGDRCREWLDTKPPRSVIYVSFGSMASLGAEAMQELGKGLVGTGKHFLWVVRGSEKSKVPEELMNAEKGLVVEWSEQVEVLSHGAVGCFVTHCGWNSTVEAVGLGVGMVAVPQWTDQPTNGKYVEDIQRCVNEVMEGERSGEIIRRNADRWRRLAVEAVSEGGSSDQNILGFVAKHFGS
ncbi:hypothetical protein J5N97_020193 [Dioscorea zingiberensis]|uniref:Deoxynivalenol-UDP-glucosyltransferase n=1 Tax=Dioscorea zingiberensis TaxID=325984 RepID=A0A9D5CFX9_9LILI|nr:hypothetical protein J5N97_020193 [Dioscorea zingiberensis]